MLSVVETLQLAIDSFNNIKMAIEEKGVTVGDTPKSEYNLLIAKIPVSSGGSEDTSELEARILELEAQVNSLTAENESLTSDKSSLLSQVNELTVRNESLNSQVAQLNSDKTSLQSQIDSKDIEIQSKTATISTYTGYLSSIGTAIVNKGGTIIEGDFSTYAAGVESIPVEGGDNTELQNQVTELTAQVDSLTSTNNSLKSCLDDIGTNITAKGGSIVAGNYSTYAEGVLSIPSGGSTSSTDGSVTQFKTYITGITFSGVPSTGLAITNGKNLFSGWSKLSELPASKIDMSTCVNIDGMFDGCTSLVTLPLYDFGSAVQADLTLDLSSANNLDLSTFSTLLKKYSGSYSRKILISDYCMNNSFTTDITKIEGKNVVLETA